ncbi:NAD-dependent SIR2 family protein deacetylase [Dietzia kunjamensis]|uniref:Sir2 family NAD-dependent protein deacetylase n=1 Tax=Dietzia kunjamensis TaxID=322509 RepID=UPI000E70B5E8|nr:Sir2 family NAD-dependent protein deacetylase [Dietzia kunjamensis]MBB1010947.1 NAD-dependent deacetylase [Dietzia kunjamensis]RKE58302.1 NAD-dependent SIR2 family protein deacetylase [Dietzia kunjamensis]
MVRIRETAWTPAERTEADRDLPDRAAALAELLRGRRAVVLTGAGISTPSGIPDYRGPDSPGRTPMTFQQFVGDPAFRRHYWARNHLGWRHMEAARPNAAHLLLADWERRGLVTGVITQNVDLLHLKAGNRRLVDLHGTYAVVICLDCGLRQSRWALHEQLERLNPGFIERVTSRGAIEVAPDADAVLAETSDFRMVDCRACSGVLKPDIVYFGENVPASRVHAANDLVDSSDVLVVVGSSLTVRSGYRFVRRAVTTGTPVAVVNRGRTRAHGEATLTIDGDCVEVLELADAALPRHG